MEIDSIYRDSINSLLIPVEGNKISGDNISLAIRNKRILKLDDAQYNYLLERALAIARRIHANPRTNVWNEEMNTLRKTLTSKQLTSFFLKKNEKSVTKEIREGWKKLSDAGLTETLDSVKEINLAFVYLHKQKKIKDLFRYYGTSQKKYLTELNKHKPAMIKLLANIEKEARLAEIKKNKTVGKEFAW